MKIKYVQYCYNASYIKELKVPDDMMFTYVDGNVGDRLHDGANHYLGCSFDTDFKFNVDLGSRVEYGFPGIVFLILNDVRLETEIPIVDSEEFTRKFELDKYYIIRSTKAQFIPKNPDVIPFEYDTIPGRFVSISKILKVRSQYLVDLFTVNLSSWLPNNTDDVKSIELDTNEKLSHLVNDNLLEVEIIKSYKLPEKLLDSINKVLSLVELSIS